MQESLVGNFPGHLCWGGYGTCFGREKIRP